MHPSEIVILTAAAAVAGAVNALAGGGMLVAYPALVAFGLSPIAANATATVALLSGGIGAQLGYRKEMKGSGPFMRGLVGPCITGGILGAFLLLKTPPRQFAAMVPGFVLLATILFAAQAQITRFAVRIHARLMGVSAAAPILDADLFAPRGTVRDLDLHRILRRGRRGDHAGELRIRRTAQHPPDERTETLERDAHQRHGGADLRGAAVARELADGAGDDVRLDRRRLCELARGAAGAGSQREDRNRGDWRGDGRVAGRQRSTGAVIRSSSPLRSSPRDHGATTR